jgi:DNA-binding transcriptional ArsR family regulator
MLAAKRTPQLAIICRENLACRIIPTLYAMINETVFSALANPVRRQVVMLLLSKERSAGSIAEAFNISRSAVSEHLSILRQAQLVQETRAGRERIYSLNAEPLVALRDWLAPYEDYWKARLADLARDLEETNE